MHTSPSSKENMRKFIGQFQPGTWLANISKCERKSGEMTEILTNISFSIVGVLPFEVTECVVEGYDFH